MQFSCESAQLAKAVNTVKKAISSSPNAPIFSGIHMSLNGNTLELVAMDVNFSMKKVLKSMAMKTESSLFLHNP